MTYFRQSKGRKIFFCFLSVFEDDDFGFIFFQKCLCFWTVISVEAKNCLIKLEIEFFGAVSAHIFPCFSVVFQNSFGDSEKTLDGGKIEIENGVAILKAFFEGAFIVSVDYPAFFQKLTVEQGIEFFPGNMFPVSAPKNFIEMNEQKLGFFGKSF